MPFFKDYPVFPETGGYNELLDATGEIRPHWRAFCDAVKECGAEKFSAFAGQTARLTTAGMSVSGDKQDVCGVVPFILSKNDFETLSAGLIQRANLLNKVLADLYGEQKSITDGVIPPQIIFGNQAFLPALKGVTPKDGIFLQEYAVDVERAPDGRFWVVEDKTQTPLGIGSAIKNRMILSRVMPDIYASCAPARVFGFIEAMRRHLFACAPRRDDGKVPLIVSLSGDAKTKLSFEEAFFARSLGVSTVDAIDLTVRGDNVYLKNIDGLKRVDVILRRINDSWCDTLELSGFSPSGVAGLTHAARKGNVALVNPLGTGVAEIPALKAFIHGLSRYFDNTDLLLPSVAAWWCGQEREKQYVLDHLDTLELYDLFGRKVTPTKDEIALRPERYTARETVNASLTPVWQHDKFVPARTRLRFHLIYENGAYHILTGGLAFTDSAGCGVRDIWVAEGTAENKTVEKPQSIMQTTPVRTTFELTSRIADNMFWLGRNLERSEQLARLLRVTLERMTNGPEIPEPDDVATLLSILALQGHLPFDDYRDAKKQKDALKQLKAVISSPDYGFGLHFLFNRLKDMADMLHDRLSMDTWELFNELPPLLPETKANAQIFLNRLKSVILRQSALSGLIREDMTREHSWRFMEIGRRLERGMQILNLLSGIDFCAGNGFNASLETLLETLDSRMTYRARYMAAPIVPLVIDLLVCDDGNPRALIYQVLKLRQNISVLGRESRQNGLFAAELEILEETIQRIRQTDVTTLAGQTTYLNETVAVNPAFNDLLTDLRSQLQNFSDRLTLSCFVHTASTRQGPSYNKGKMK